MTSSRMPPTVPANRRPPAAQDYRDTASQLVSSLRNADINLSIIDADADDWREEHARTSGTRIERFAEAQSDADRARRHADEVRAAHDLQPREPSGAGSPEATTPPDEAGTPLGRTVDAALGTVQRRRQELDRAQEEFQAWRVRYDAHTAVIVVTALVTTGLVAIAAMLVLSGFPVLSLPTLGLLAIATVAVVAVGVVVATLRGHPGTVAETRARRVAARVVFAGKLVAPVGAALIVTRLFAEALP